MKVRTLQACRVCSTVLVLVTNLGPLTPRMVAINNFNEIVGFPVCAGNVRLESILSYCGALRVSLDTCLCHGGTTQKSQSGFPVHLLPLGIFSILVGLRIVQEIWARRGFFLPFFSP